MLLSDEELHNEGNDLSDVGRHRRVVRMHLVDDGLQQMSHSLQHLVFKSLHILFYFFVLINEHTACLTPRSFSGALATLGH